MSLGMVGKKAGMTRIFDNSGISVPVTAINIIPNQVSQIKTLENDGYKAIQISYGEVKEKANNKPINGHYKKANIKPGLGLIEFRIEDEDKQDLKIGDSLNLDIFKEGELKKLTGYNLITLKPIFVVLNSDTELIENESNENLTDYGSNFLYPSKLEMELSELPKIESNEFRESLNINANLKYNLIKALFEGMGKIIFITAGDQEIRAWEIEKGDTALISASKIHSDISKGFIRAEVIEFDTFLKLGSWNECKKEGKVKGNGKEYVVNDGDIINFLHS